MIGPKLTPAAPIAAPQELPHTLLFVVGPGCEMGQSCRASQYCLGHCKVPAAPQKPVAWNPTGRIVLKAVGGLFAEQREFLSTDTRYTAPAAPVPQQQDAHWPILYAILRPAILSGNEAVRHHAERLWEVLEGDKRAAVRELLDREPQIAPPARVRPGAGVPQQQDALAVLTELVAADDAIGTVDPVNSWENLTSRLDAAWDRARALASNPPAPLPEGMVMVPKEPTPEMWNAAWSAFGSVQFE